MISRALLFLLVFIPFFSISQVKITGTVLNMTDTKPVASASVFLDGTTTGNETANDGTFILNNVKPGKYDLIVSILGYETYLQSILVGKQDINLAPINLISTAIQLQAVKIKPNNKWYRLYKIFKEEFLGTSKYALQSKILNPDSLDLNYDTKTRQLTARSRGFLIIENKALGYRINYLLVRFVKDSRQKQLLYKGFTKFEDIKGSPAERLEWKKNRLDCYNGSSMHFLRAVIKDKVAAEGFEVYKVVRSLNPAYGSLPTKNGLVEADTDANYKYRERFSNVILERIDYFDETDIKGIYALDHPNSLYIIYKNRMDYDKSRAWVYTQFDMPNWETSIAVFTEPASPADTSSDTPSRTIMVAYPGYWSAQRMLKRPYALFDSNGKLTDPSSIFYEGYWAFMRIADTLPADYEP